MAIEQQTPTRDDAWKLVCEHVQKPALRRHMLAVETAMRAYARERGADEDLWGVVGLLHDFDWEIHPDLEQHPQHGAPILREHGYSEEIIHGILTHADHLSLPRETPMQKSLFAVD